MLIACVQARVSSTVKCPRYRSSKKERGANEHPISFFGLDTLAIRVFGWKPLGAGIFAAGLGALIFSAFHYVGPYGDPWQLGSFTFRAVAGLLFSGLYLLRGFGITAWSHALYDVFLTLGS